MGFGFDQNAQLQTSVATKNSMFESPVDAQNKYIFPF